MMKTVTVTEASRNFSELVSTIHYGRMPALLMKAGKPMVKVVPARRASTGKHLAELWPSLPHLSREDADAFSADVTQRTN